MPLIFLRERIEKKNREKKLHKVEEREWCRTFQEDTELVGGQRFKKNI